MSEDETIKLNFWKHKFDNEHMFKSISMVGSKEFIRCITRQTFSVARKTVRKRFKFQFNEKQFKIYVNKHNIGNFGNSAFHSNDFVKIIYLNGHFVTKDLKNEG